MPKYIPSLSLGNILTIISMAVGGLWVLSSMNEAAARQDEKIRSAREDIIRIQREHEKSREEIKADMKDIRADVRELLRRTPMKGN